MTRNERNWYQNKVDEEIYLGVDSRDKVKRKERSDQLLVERMMLVDYCKPGQLGIAESWKVNYRTGKTG